jgi:predicted nucleotidyltransferase
MFEHHRKTIENLKRHFEKNPDYLAFILNGSVAREEAGEVSDVDFFLVVENDKYEEALNRNVLLVEASELSVPPCPEANGFLTSKDRLKAICEQGNEIERWAFFKAKIVFSRDKEVEELVKRIPHYPEEGRIRRMESYHSQMYYHFSFFEFAYYSQTKYLIYETATKMILSVGRLILADNQILYPNRKWFYRELAKVADKPEGICEAMIAFLDHPTIDAGNEIIQMVESYKPYPVPPEGMAARIHSESVLNLEAW